MAILPARRRAVATYRWGEDGIAGFSDRHGLICLAPAFWNGRDPILKERLFGLSGPEGNHGEDAKEYWFHLDATPTHSYMRMLYKYPQREFPYRALVEESARRTRQDPEFELLDTGVFEESRYWDIFVTYAKASPEDLLVTIEAFNRGPDERRHILRRSGSATRSWGLDMPRLAAAEPRGLAVSSPSILRDRTSLYVEGRTSSSGQRLERAQALGRKARRFVRTRSTQRVVHGGGRREPRRVR